MRDRSYNKYKEKTTQVIGFNSEQIAERALAALKSEEKIDDYRKEDYNGVDFVIKQNGTEVRIQIKSSFLAASRKHLDLYPDIPVIVVRTGFKITPHKAKQREISTKAKIMEVLEHIKRGEQVRII